VNRSLLPRTVRANPADCPALHRGPSVKSHRTNRSTPRTTDRPRGARGLSARHPRTVRPLLRTVRNSVQPKLKITTDRNEEHWTNMSGADRPLGGRGSSARLGQNRKTSDLESQLPQIIIGFPKRLKLWR
jgi:hypothetical protein